MSVKIGKTYSIGNNHNLYWELGDKRGNDFEDIIYTYIKMIYKGKNNITIEQTPSVNDGGKDIIIKFTEESLSIFGITFKRRDSKETIIYIECKSTDNKKLRREKYFPSVENVIHTGCKMDYFVLLTNSTILAKDRYHIKIESERIGAQFILVDQYILARQLNTSPYDKLNNAPFYEGDDHFYLEYQVYNSDSVDNQLDIYFIFRNYSTSQKSYTLSLLTNLNWITQSNVTQISVEPFDSFTIKYSLSKENKTNYNDIQFVVYDGSKQYPVIISNPAPSIKYNPQFIGEQHKSVVDTILSGLQNEDFDKLFCLWGDAGVGKTRITLELENKFKKNAYFDFYSCTLKTNNISTINDIYSFLRKKEFLKSNVSNNVSDFKRAIASCHNLVNISIIVIDDFHNCSKQFIEQVKELKSHSAPVILILCGRTDYSAGNTDYYNFVEWTNQNLIKGKTVWNIEPLKTEDTKKFIRCSIQNVPEAVYDSIYKNSQNNPLFIVQYVEHLLDEKIAYLENENTISIYNTYKVKLIDTLPKKINDIYEKRIHFVQETGKEKRIDYYMFLLILTVYNGQISESNAREFDSDALKISFLMKRRFIKKLENSYIFEHESIKIFLSEKLKSNRKVRETLSREMLNHIDNVSDYPEYTLAKLYYWTKQKALALKEFKPIIDSVAGENNFSNISIDASIYNYIDDVLELIVNDEQYKNIAKKLINTKIYISLHHFIPINAVRDCNMCLEYISKVTFLQNDKVLINSIYAQKAHSLLNSGMNFEGTLILNELQAKMMMDKSGFDYQSIFDIADRLCAIYIKFNCYSIAQEYSNLEIKIASENNDSSLLAIAYRTRSKLYYLQSSNKCYSSLNQVDLYLNQSQSSRIKLNNRIYREIVNLSYIDAQKEIISISDTENIALEAYNNHFNRAYIQSNLLLAAQYLKRGINSDLISAESRANTALDFSIRFGIPSYIWQIHNLKAIIALRLGKGIKEIKQQFNSAFNVLKAQNLLFIGNKDLCYSNILAISNIAFFIRQNYSQDYFNSKMSEISYYHNEHINNSLTAITQQPIMDKDELDYLYKTTNTEVPKLLFCTSPNESLLRDDKTGYFIALS